RRRNTTRRPHDKSRHKSVDYRSKRDEIPGRRINFSFGSHYFPVAYNLRGGEIGAAKSCPFKAPERDKATPVPRGAQDKLLPVFVSLWPEPCDMRCLTHDEATHLQDSQDLSRTRLNISNFLSRRDAGDSRQAFPQRFVTGREKKIESHEHEAHKLKFVTMEHLAEQTRQPYVSQMKKNDTFKVDSVSLQSSAGPGMLNISIGTVEADHSCQHLLSVSSRQWSE
ncbi:hypothetical protein BaRGS_00010460, partial [Batillaria attramentaria]